MVVVIIGLASSLDGKSGKTRYSEAILGGKFPGGSPKTGKRAEARLLGLFHVALCIFFGTVNA
jgi:hypothetical protein